jgi:hypothetical protein|tara:strand:- start:165 stop:428 length:264 start_codon:yes stop_codon:yes gene_type:complete
MKNYRQFKTSIREAYLRVQERGSTYGVTLNWRGKTIFTQMFFPDVFTRPTRSSVVQAIRKIYPDAKLIAYNPTRRDPTKPLLFFGEN